jgi:hypothetical protein
VGVYGRLGSIELLSAVGRQVGTCRPHDVRARDGGWSLTRVQALQLKRRPQRGHQRSDRLNVAMPASHPRAATPMSAGTASINGISPLLTQFEMDPRGGRNCNGGTG